MLDLSPAMSFSLEEPKRQPEPFNLTSLDREVLGQTDEEFIPHDWQDLKKIIGTSHIRQF